MDKLSPKELFEKILKEEKHCILATASLDGKPEAALIEYTSDSDYNIYFETFPDYRKYSNLKKNPRASIVINRLPQSIQIDGTAEELKGERSEKAKQLCTKKHGVGKGYFDDPQIRFFKFTPNWIRIILNDNYPPEKVIIMGKE